MTVGHLSRQIGVIIPVFNKAAHLRECLDSVLGQTHGDLEAICVDDGSTDASAEILDEYAMRDARVRVIRDEGNRGPGPARNLALASTSAPYVQFTDADDWLPAESLERLHRLITTDRVDLVRGAVAMFWTGGIHPVQIGNPVPEMRRVPPLDWEALWIPWRHQGYLFAREFLVRERIEFPRLLAGEDAVFLTASLCKAPLISTTNEVTYQYRLQPLADKNRVSFSHLRDYVAHAALVRDLFLQRAPACWTRGYGPFVLDDIAEYARQCELSDDERRDIDRQVANLRESIS